MITSLTQLSHRPVGDEHPYQPGAGERTPRYPLAGECVSLNIQTAPEVSQVTVLWAVNGSAQVPISAVLAEPGIWQAVIPAQSAGADILYSLESAVETQGPYTYKVCGWQKQSPAIGWTQVKPDVWEGHLAASQTTANNSTMGPLTIISLYR